MRVGLALRGVGQTLTSLLPATTCSYLLILLFVIFIFITRIERCCWLLCSSMAGLPALLFRVADFALSAVANCSSVRRPRADNWHSREDKRLRVCGISHVIRVALVVWEALHFSAVGTRSEAIDATGSRSQLPMSVMDFQRSKAWKASQVCR